MQKYRRMREIYRGLPLPRTPRQIGKLAVDAVVIGVAIKVVDEYKDYIVHNSFKKQPLEPTLDQQPDEAQPPTPDEQ